MDCLNCGHKNSIKSRFCGHCGVFLAAPTCSDCGWSLISDDKFCPGCGQKIESTTQPQNRQSNKTREHPVPPIQYMPSHLAAQVLSARSAIEGERKHATILFADIVDSTRLTYGDDVEVAHERLTPAVDVMREAVFRYEGYVRPRGDGIQGLFGVPLAHEDHAIRGCYAALDILEAVSKLNRERRKKTGEFIQVRIGLNSGEILVKVIHDDLLIEIDAIGPTVAVASRMENLAIPGTIQMTASTFALTEGFVDAKNAGQIPVRGIDEPVEVYHLKEALSVSTHIRGIASRPLTRFVGRDLEMQALARVRDIAKHGHGQVFAFVGEAGVGKTRLVWEFVRSSHKDDVLVLDASSVSYGQSALYLPIIDLLKKYFRVHPHQNEDEIKAKIDTKLASLDHSILSYKWAIFDLFDLNFDDPEWHELDPVQRRQRILDAVTGIIFREAQLQPLCLVFENLQWIDSETEALLDNIVESLPRVPILLLVNYRPEYKNHWIQKTYFSQVAVGALPKAGAIELLDSLLSTNKELSSLKNKLIEATDGNPFFLEESVQTLKEQNVLSFDQTTVRLSNPLNKVEVPVSVQSTLEARIDRLEPDHKYLLQFCSVVGKSVPQAVLKEAIDLSEEDFSAGLAKLQWAEFLYETNLYPDREFTFKHALTYQVAYGTLPKGRKQSMHAKVMRAMEVIISKNDTEHVEKLAYHAFRGGLWEKAAQYSFGAGKKLFDRSANRESISYLDLALTALRELPDDAAQNELSVDIRFLLRKVLLNLGEVERIGQVLEETKPLIISLSDPRRAGQFEAFLSNHYCVTGDQAKALEHGQIAVQIGENTEDVALRVEMAYRLAQPLYRLAKYHDAIDALKKGLTLIAPDRHADRLGMSAIPSVVCLTWLSHCCAELGDFTTGAQYASEAVEIIDQMSHPLSMVFAYWGLGHVLLRQCKYAEAAIVYEKGLDVCQQWSLRVWFPRLASALGMARALNGSAVEAISQVEEAVQTAQSMGFSVDKPRLHERLASVHSILGNYDLAEKEAKKALKFSMQADAPGHQAWALRQLGEIYAKKAKPNLKQASEYYREALALAGELGMRPLSAHCYEGIGRLHEQRGHNEKARTAFDTAALLWREMETQSVLPSDA